MIGRLNHVAIAVADLGAATARYRDVLGGDVSAPKDLAEHGVTVVFVTLPNTKIELMAPLGNESPIAKFVAKGGGIHHLCYEVENIETAIATVGEAGYRILGDGSPRIGAHGTRVVFLHPSETDGALIELEEIGARVG